MSYGPGFPAVPATHQAEYAVPFGLPVGMSSESGSVEAQVVDLAGNLGSLASQAVTFDITPPAAPTVLDLADASDSGVSNTDNLTNITSPTFTGTAEAGSTVALFDGTTLLGSGTADGAGAWSVTATTAQMFSWVGSSPCALNPV